MFSISAPGQDGSVRIDPLLDLAFGADRTRKTSYRFRHGLAPVAALSRIATADEGGDLIGSIQYWPIVLADVPSLLLGPLAIHPQRQNQGIGRALVDASLPAAAALGYAVVFLVGDIAYYRRFGFVTVPDGIVMPSEDPRRLQWRHIRPWPVPIARPGRLT